MKSTNMREKKEKLCTILPGILTQTMVILLCMPHMIPATYAQSPSSGIGWHAAMAMGNLAERENRIEEQKTAKTNETTIAAVNPVADNDKIEHGKSSTEKDTLEQ
jgi:hypothetical protein